MKVRQLVYAMTLILLPFVLAACTFKREGLIKITQRDGVSLEGQLALRPENFPEALSIRQAGKSELALVALEVQSQMLTLVGLTPFFSRAYVIRYEKDGRYFFEPGPQKPPLKAETLLLAVLSVYGLPQTTFDMTGKDCRKIDSKGSELCLFSREAKPEQVRFSLYSEGHQFLFAEATL